MLRYIAVKSAIYIESNNYVHNLLHGFTMSTVSQSFLPSPLCPQSVLHGIFGKSAIYTESTMSTVRSTGELGLPPYISACCSGVPNSILATSVKICRHILSGCHFSGESSGEHPWLFSLPLPSWKLWPYRYCLRGNRLHTVLQWTPLFLLSYLCAQLDTVVCRQLPAIHFYVFWQWQGCLKRVPKLVRIPLQFPGLRQTRSIDSIVWLDHPRLASSKPASCCLSRLHGEYCGDFRLTALRYALTCSTFCLKSVSVW